jgi:isopentenyl diphosphate isomerase/L-lactate dehydrogenase-like FMN-dependent dehydrogenase
MAGPFLKAAAVSADSAIEKATEISSVLRIAMFAAGAGDLEQLAHTRLQTR